MPVVLPCAPHDAMVFFLANLPAAFIGFVDDEFLDVILAPQPFRKDHAALRHVADAC